MNASVYAAHSNASRSLRLLADRTLSCRNLRDQRLTNTPRTVLFRACSSLTASGWHSLQKQESCTRLNFRQIHGGPSGSSSPLTFRDRLLELRRNGTPEIAFGAIILTLAGIDYVLQARNDQQKEDVYRQLEREVRRDEATTREEDSKMLNEGVASKAKFECIIRKVPQNFDGHKCLKNVKMGDVVTVIEEGVGPGGQYNLCSIVRATANNAGKESSNDEQSVSIGWFPCSCLQKIE